MITVGWTVPLIPAVNGALLLNKTNKIDFSLCVSSCGRLTRRSRSCSLLNLPVLSVNTWTWLALRWTQSWTPRAQTLRIRTRAHPAETAAETPALTPQRRTSVNTARSLTDHRPMTCARRTESTLKSCMMGRWSSAFKTRGKRMTAFCLSFSVHLSSYCSDCSTV